MSVSVLERGVTNVSIYALAEPSGEVRYVGKTDWPLWHRLSGHKTKARRSPDTYVSKWVKSLLDAGDEPTIILLEEVAPGDNWATVERYWIKQMRAFGCRLANASDGGEGGMSGHLHTVETKAQMSESAKVRCSDPAERARLASITNRKPPTGKGEKNNFARFTDAQVIEMRERRAGGETLQVIADAFQSNRATIHGIVTGKQWAHVGGPLQQVVGRQRLTDEQVEEIRQFVMDGGRQSDAALRYGVTPHYVNDLIYFRRRKSL